MPSERKKSPPSRTTVTSAVIELHYQKLGLIPYEFERWKRNYYKSPSWNNDRVSRLCRLLDCELNELLMYVLVCPDDARRYIEKDSWPSTICLHFEILETHQISQLLNVTKLIHPPHAFCASPKGKCPSCGRKIPSERLTEKKG